MDSYGDDCENVRTYQKGNIRNLLVSTFCYSSITSSFIIVLLLFQSCNKAYETNQPIKTPNHEVLEFISSPKIIKVELDSLEKVPISKTIQIPDHNKTIPYLGNQEIQLDSPKILYLPENLIKYTPGKNGIPLPKVYHLPDEPYQIQHGDTIVPPKIIKAGVPKILSTLPMRMKENATKDIQFLSSEHGMPALSIRDIFDDKAGNIWMALEGVGLCRYDGINFYYYSDEEGLNTTAPYFTYQDSHDNVWIASASDGVCKFDGINFTHYNTQNGLIDATIESITEDSKGNMWFVAEKGAARFDGKSFFHYTKDHGLEGEQLSYVYCDQQDNLWFGEREGILTKYDGTSFIQYFSAKLLSKEDKNYQSKFYSIYEDSQNNLWFGTVMGGLAKFDGEKFSIYNYGGVHKEFAARVMSIKEDSRGYLWLGDHQGINQIKSNQEGQLSFISYNLKSGLSDNFVYSLFEDKVGNIWVSGWGKGLFNLKYNSFTHFTFEETFKGKTIQAIQEDDEGNLWFGTRLHGVLKFDGNSLVQYDSTNGLIDNTIHQIKKDDQGNLWMASKHGFNFFNGTQFINYTAESLRDIHVHDILLKDSSIWLGTNKGIRKFDGYTLTTIDKKDYDGPDLIPKILEWEL